MKIFITRIIVALQLVLLAACTTTNSSFDCPNKAGINCKSLDQINHMVDSGQIQGRDLKNQNLASNTNFQYFSNENSDQSMAKHLRAHEEIQRIWLAPYEDTEGNYHQASFIYTVMEPGHWQGIPMRKIQTV